MNFKHERSRTTVPNTPPETRGLATTVTHELDRDELDRKTKAEVANLVHHTCVEGASEMLGSTYRAVYNLPRRRNALDPVRGYDGSRRPL